MIRLLAREQVRSKRLRGASAVVVALSQTFPPPGSGLLEVVLGAHIQTIIARPQNIASSWAIKGAHRDLHEHDVAILTGCGSPLPSGWCDIPSFIHLSKLGFTNNRERSTPNEIPGPFEYTSNSKIYNSV